MVEIGNGRAIIVCVECGCLTRMVGNEIQNRTNIQEAMP